MYLLSPQIIQEIFMTLVENSQICRQSEVNGDTWYCKFNIKAQIKERIGSPRSWRQTLLHDDLWVHLSSGDKKMG